MTAILLHFWEAKSNHSVPKDLFYKLSAQNIGEAVCGESLKEKIAMCWRHLCVGG